MSNQMYPSMYQPGVMYGSDVYPRGYQPGVMYGVDVTPEGEDILPSKKDLSERAYQEEAMRQAQQVDPFMIPQQPSPVQYDPQTAMLINQQIYGANFDKGDRVNPLVEKLRKEFPRLQQQAANDPRQAAEAMLGGTVNALTGGSVPFTDAGEQTLLDTAAAQGFLQQLGRFEPR